LKKDASANTKRAIRDAMRACFRHHYRHRKPTFSDVSIRSDASEAHVRRVEAAKAGVIHSMGTAYAPEQLFKILIQAAVNDYLGILSKPNVTNAVANTPDAIIWQVCMLTRISELMRLRWNGYVDKVGDRIMPTVDPDRCGGMVYVPDAKTTPAPRWVILWNAFEPWVERMRRISLSASDGTGFVFQVPEREINVAPSVSTYTARIARAAASSRLKWEGRATHIFRATGATYIGTRLPEEKIKLMLGHSRKQSFSGATGSYIDPEILVTRLPNEVWSFMNGLIPSPDDVFSAASEELRARGREVDLTVYPRLQLAH
jgi:integrase